MKWIKASERLPEPFKNLPIRNIKSGKFSISQLRGGFFYSTENEIDEIKNIEWLDESQPQDSNVGVNEAIEFAKWIHTNYAATHSMKWMKRNIDGKLWDTEELYKIFHASQPQKEEVNEDEITDELAVLIRDGLDQLEIHKWWDYGDFEDIRDKDDCGYNIAKSISENYSITRKQ